MALVDHLPGGVLERSATLATVHRLRLAKVGLAASITGKKFLELEG